MNRPIYEAFEHLLNNCIFTIGKTTYVDFLPFFNPNGGSELNILRIIAHHKRFELLTHPLCELFLHLKWLQSRSLYWIVILLNLVFTLLTLAYVMLNYGKLDFINASSNKCENMNCYGQSLKIPLLVLSIIISLVAIAKMLQDRDHLWSHLRHRSEDLINLVVLTLIIVDQFNLESDHHKAVSALMVLLSCRSLVFTIARDPNIAIFVEMFDDIKHSIGKIFLTYISFFLGWGVAFHVLLNDSENDPQESASFDDIGSSMLKVLTMFTGDLGYENAFANNTQFSRNFPKENRLSSLAIYLLYMCFVIEMCVIMMNLTIGLSISNIQVSFETERLRDLNKNVPKCIMSPI